MEKFEFKASVDLFHEKSGQYKTGVVELLIEEEADDLTAAIQKATDKLYNALEDEGEIIEE